MLSVTVNQASIASIKKTIAELGANVRKELAVAVNKTTKQCKIQGARELGKILPVPIKTLKKTIGQKRKANERLIEAVIILREGYEFPLKFFKPVQDATGVTVRMDKRIKGKKGLTKILHAFQGPRPGVMKRTWKGNVFQRIGEKQKMTKGRYKDKMRQPIQKLVGPSPGQAFKDADIANLVVAVGQQELQKQVTERIRFLTLKASGNLRGKQK